MSAQPRSHDQLSQLVILCIAVEHGKQRKLHHMQQMQRPGMSNYPRETRAAVLCYVSGNGLVHAIIPCH